MTTKGLTALCCALAVLASNMAAAADRLITLGGDVTEIVFALGAGDQVVAVDSSSLYPAEVAALPQVGYLRALSAEGLLSLDADRVLANSDMGPPAVRRQLAAAGQQVEFVASTPSPEALYSKIRTLAELLDKTARGEALIAELQAEFKVLAERGRALAERPRVLFVMNHGGSAPMIAGAGTAADSMISLMGAKNAAAAIQGYKPMTAEAVVAAAPQWLLITDQGLAQFGGAQALMSQAGVSLTPAAKQGQLLSMDALLLLGFGPRSAEAARRLFNAVHGEASSVARRPD